MAKTKQVNEYTRAADAYEASVKRAAPILEKGATDKATQADKDAAKKIRETLTTEKDKVRRLRFKHVAKTRGKKMVQGMKALGNLSNKKHYAFVEGDINVLLVPLENAIAHVRRSFEQALNTDTSAADSEPDTFAFE